MPPIKRFECKLMVAVTEQTRFAIEKQAIAKGLTVSDICRDLLDSGLKNLLGD